MTHSAEKDAPTRFEWQAPSGSRTWHVMDATRPQWENPDGSRRRSGPRSLCGRYPQRNAESPWLRWPADEPEVVARLSRHYALTRCGDCLDALRVVPPSKAQADE